jgi:hypothetical protein
LPIPVRIQAIGFRKNLTLTEGEKVHSAGAIGRDVITTGEEILGTE